MGPLGHDHGFAWEAQPDGPPCHGHALGLAETARPSIGALDALASVLPIETEPALASSWTADAPIVVSATIPLPYRLVVGVPASSAVSVVLTSLDISVVLSQASHTMLALRDDLPKAYKLSLTARL
jgi:hypothetical protein